MSRNSRLGGAAHPFTWLMAVHGSRVGSLGGSTRTGFLGMSLCGNLKSILLRRRRELGRCHNRDCDWGLWPGFVIENAGRLLLLLLLLLRVTSIISSGVA